MSGSHGDLYSEIGKLVLAAHAGQAIDLTAKSEELAQRYWALGVPAGTIAKAIARSIGAIGVSMELVSGRRSTANGSNGHAAVVTSDAIRVSETDEQLVDALPAMPISSRRESGEEGAKPVSKLFPSGVRLAVLS